MNGPSKLVVVSPDFATGRGGISSSIAAISPELARWSSETTFITSHREGARFRAFIGAAAEIIAMKGQPRVLWLHCGPWLSLLRKMLLAWIARDNMQAIVVHLHSPRIEAYLSHPVTRLLASRLISRADAIVVLSDYWRQLVVSRAGVDASRVFVLPNAVPQAFVEIAASDRAPQNARHLRSDETVQLISVARLVPEKGVDRVIRALAHLPARFRLTVAGDGAERTSLEELAKSLGVSERTTFCGWVSGDAKRSLLLHSDVFCLPSRYDSFGISFVEAMACGLPVVALRSPSIEQVVTHMKDGVLVESDDPKTLAGAISTAHSMRQLLGAAGRSNVLRHYSPDAIANRTIAVFSEAWSRFARSASGAPR